MKKQRLRWPMLMAGTLLFATTAAVAFGPAGNCGGDKPMAAVYRLNTLTDSQRQQLDALREQRRSVMLEMRKSRSGERQQLREAVRSGDPATLRPLAERYGQRVADRLVRQAEMRQQIMAILTPEQRQELDRMAAERRGRWNRPAKGGQGQRGS